MLPKILAIVVGVLFAAFFIHRFRKAGAEREPQLFAVALIVAAWIYVGFATFGGGLAFEILQEMLGVFLFTAAALLGGWSGRPVWLGIGWTAHIAWDMVIHGSGTPYVPRFYPELCAGFDGLFALYLLRRFGWKS